MTRATVQQLVDCIRRYQRANTLDEMAQADDLASRLIGPLPAVAEKAPNPPKRKAKA